MNALEGLYPYLQVMSVSPGLLTWVIRTIPQIMAAVPIISKAIIDSLVRWLICRLQIIGRGRKTQQKSVMTETAAEA